MLQHRSATTQRWTALLKILICLPLQVSCQVEGSVSKFLTLTGACAAPRAEGGPIEFRTCVRGSATQELTLTNPSVTPWQLAPVVHNDTWSGPELLAVPAGGSAKYPITYRPLAMATADKPHEGSVFFPIPDGTAVQFSLRGVADDPQPTDTIHRQVGSRGWLVFRNLTAMASTLQQGAPPAVPTSSERMIVEQLDDTAANPIRA